jgi:hypothetical protein
MEQEANMQAMTSFGCGFDSIDSSRTDCSDDVLTGATLVERPDDMARLLLAASPHRAASFALVAHERACWTQDDDRMDFWRAVIAWLASPSTGTASHRGTVSPGARS